MEVNESQLLERYAQMETDELLVLRLGNSLSEVAKPLLEFELEKREYSDEDFFRAQVASMEDQLSQEAHEKATSRMGLRFLWIFLWFALSPFVYKLASYIRELF